MKLLYSRHPWQIVLSVMLVILACIAFWPNPIDQPVQGQLAGILDFLHRVGIPHWVDYKFIEASANVLLFIPLGMSSVPALPKKRWWQVGAFGLSVSGCMELGQLLFLHNRLLARST